MAIIKSLSDQVYDYIINNIRYGSIAIGAKLDESSISDMLQISKTPVREALIQLTSDGFIENVPRKGFYVKNISMTDIIQGNQVVACLDYHAALLAMPKLDSTDFDKMNNLVEALDDTLSNTDYINYCQIQEKFHDVYLLKCGNDILVNTLRTTEMRYFRRTFYDKDYGNLFPLLKVTNNEHKEMIRLLFEQDKVSIKSVIEKHWTKAPDLL